MTPIRGSQLPPTALSSYDSQSILIPGAIQPHGMLVAVDEADLRIVYVSQNCEQWLGQSCEQLIGRSLDALLAPQSVAVLRECLGECSETISSLRMLQFTPDGRDPLVYWATAHRSSNISIIELERLPRTGTLVDESEFTLIGKSRLANHRLAQCEGIDELFRVVTQEIRLLTGFDRIMVYQFDEEWNGAVIAEDCLDSLEPYLGLHFPASDIAAVARAMFLLNGLRMIPDVQYQPSALFPSVHPDSGKPLDLSRAHLRSVSPIHLEYLRNMGVRASLTISLVVDGKLWGLIACHHRTARPFSPMLREFCELLGQTVSLQLSERLRLAGKQVATRSEAVLLRLADRVQRFGSIVPALLADEHDLLALTNAQGAVLWRDGEPLAVGLTPPLDWTKELQSWVASATAEPIFFTNCLSSHFPSAEVYADVASGLLALAIARSPDVYILWFRREVIQLVEWTGDPSKSVDSVSDKGRLHRRKSFARWKESLRHRSRPWLDGEIETATRLRSILQDRLSRTAEQLDRLLPICAWCKKIRTDESYWQQLEVYFSQHTDIRFNHGMCPECFKQKVAQLAKSSGRTRDCGKGH